MLLLLMLKRLGARKPASVGAARHCCRKRCWHSRSRSSLQSPWNALLTVIHGWSPFEAGACEEAVRDAVGKCTEKKDGLVHLKKSLQQGRKDLGRALAARAKMATKASEREEALKSKRGAFSAASGKAGKGGGKGVGSSSEKPMSLPPIFEASPVQQIDASWADQTGFFSNTSGVDFDQPWCIAAAESLGDAEQPPLSTTTECFAKKCTKLPKGSPDASTAIVKGSGDVLAERALSMFCPPDSLWFPDGTNVKTLPPQVGAIGKTAFLYGLCEPVVTFEAAGLGTLYACLRGESTWRITVLTEWLGWCVRQASVSEAEIRSTQLLTAWKCGKVRVGDTVYEHIFTVTLQPGGLLWVPPCAVVARAPHDCRLSVLLRKSFTLGSKTTHFALDKLFKMKCLDMAFKASERVGQEVALLRAVMSVLEAKDVFLLKDAKARPLRAPQ